MSLQPILKLLDVADDATSITVQDATGNYSGSNTGGFGSPNPTKGSVSGIILQLYSMADTTVYVPYRLLSTANIFGTGEILTADKFPGITTGTVYKDGVYGIKFNVLYSGVGSISYIAGTKQFSLTNADSIFAAAIGFILPDNTSKIYYIDRTKTLDASGGYVTSALPLTGSPASYELTYEGDLKLLVDKAGDKCLVEDIGIWANEGCKDDNFKNIWTRYMQKIALKNKFTQGYLTDAHKLAVALENYCDCQTPYTPCC